MSQLLISDDKITDCDVLFEIWYVNILGIVECGPLKDIDNKFQMFWYFIAIFKNNESKKCIKSQMNTTVSKIFQILFK